ncbi:hypothetical protein IKF89_02570 [Candidatus Saccharibacteria bacterium]|nr:hypothetical protein [Candidatus Saccharibacteria bacterium]
MARRLFLLLFSAVMGITVMPDMLASADSFELTGANFREVETVPLPEPEPEVATTAIPVAYEVPVSVSQQVNYTVTAYSGEILADGLSYSDIYKTGNLVYGHNSANLLGNLGSLGVGSEFTITEGGVARAYQVANVVLFEKNDGKLQLNGQGSFMKAVAGAKFYGAQYDVAVMTCAGTAFGNGDASHRLVVFANAI